MAATASRTSSSLIYPCAFPGYTAQTPDTPVIVSQPDGFKLAALIAANCVKGYAFLNELDPLDLELAESSHHYKLDLWKMLGDDFPVSRN